jgi:hypothetical protein
MATTQAEAIQTAYNSSQHELEDLQGAALEACQSVVEGDAQAGSSMERRLRALGGHVTCRMRRVLRLGVQKTLGVVVALSSQPRSTVHGLHHPRGSRRRWC